ncbi:MAG: UUP1 family membrane protein, partial [Gammaproteobacteria bacterium]|nr:UUP1 family membrane protein [Gammaproteobacteria bacterium]
TTATENGNRKAVWSIRRAKGQQVLYYRAVVYRTQAKEPPVELPASAAQAPALTGPRLEAVKSLLSETHAKSADVESMAAELLKRLSKPQADPNVAVLLNGQDTALKRAEVAVQVLGQAGVAARVVNGLRLQEQGRNAVSVHWLEIYYKDKWRAFDPATGTPGVPDDYLAWWRGAMPMVEAQGAARLQINLSVNRNLEAAINNAYVRARVASPRLLEYSLFSLPVHTQLVYRVLLMIPIGALILVVLRNVVGIKTFGTFMPILIALAFRDTQLLWGMVLFSVLVALGLTVRFYLEHLKLLLVPRLASVLTMVILMMALVSVVSHKLGLERGLSVSLFPMVILTMTIERMSIVWEERGPGMALQEAFGSLLVAAVTYAVINTAFIEHLVFVFPELLLVVLAIILLLGRYTGYRLLELRRFKALARGAS